jgi:uncharacterized Fe-S cluster-containing MiaB family protein
MNLKQCERKQLWSCILCGHLPGGTEEKIKTLRIINEIIKQNM